MNSFISKLSKTLIATAIIATAVLTSVPALSAFAATQTPNNYICTFKKDASYIYWTPIILLNSPYGGSPSASTAQGYTGEYSIGGVTSSTTQQVGWQMSLSNGEAAGLFELANWTYYTSIYGACPNYVPMKPISSEQYYTLYLLPSGSQSDNDKIGYFVYNGYSSIQFNNDYSTLSYQVITTNGPGTSETVLSTSTTALLFSVTFPSASNYVGSGNLDISVSYYQSGTASFTYNFPGSFGTWNVDSFNGQTGSNTQGALGFEFV
jgi:hypothetical protein